MNIFVLAALSCVVLLRPAEALTSKEIDAFKARTWTEGNTGVQGTVSITENSKGNLVLKSNGIPDHPTGAFDGSRDYPNYIYEKDNEWIVKKKPTIASSPGCLPMGPVAMATNGVSIYNPFSAGCCDAGESELNLFDTCWGHPSPDNSYHYHTAPLCNIMMLCSEPSGIVGVAFDGFPIYGPIDENGKELKTADLDECHGKISSDGSYRYHVTADYPYFMSCFKGDVLPKAGIGNNCQCDINNPADPCEEFGGGGGGGFPPPPPPRQFVQDAILKKDVKMLRQLLGLRTDGSFQCCEDAANCDYVYNANTNIPLSNGK